MSRKIVRTYFSGLVALHVMSRSMASVVDLPLMKPYCLPVRFADVCSWSLWFIAFSSTLPRTGSRLTGLYDFGCPISLSGPLSIGTTCADFHVEGNLAAFRHSFVSFQNLVDKLGHKTRSMIPVIPSIPGALFGAIDQTNRLNCSSEKD